MNLLKSILFVAIGGAVGSVARFLICQLFNESFPFGTLAVNVLGSFIIGMLVGYVAKEQLSPEMKLLLMTGFCGGFTTFSTFALESFSMMNAGDIILAAIYISISVCIGIIAVCLGLQITQR